MMKKKQFLAAVLAVAAFVSCNKDDDATALGVTGGKSTMATVELTQSPATMAAPGTAKTPTAAETKVTDAYVYVFNSADVLEAKEALVNDGTGVFKQTFKITDGTKKFYVAANFGAETNYPGILGAAKNAILAEIKTITSLATAATADNFWMTNTVEVTQVINAGVDQATAAAGSSAATNFVKVPIGRAVAKVACDFVAADSDADQPAGRLTDVSYRVKNVPVKMYFQPYPANATWTTPDYADVTVTASDYILTAEDATAFVATGKGPLLATGVATTPCSNFFYAMENKNNTPKEGNTTYIVVKGTFTPKTTLDAEGLNDAAGVKDADFWRIINTAGEFLPGYYRAEPSAARITAVGGDATVKYTAGVSYYRLWIADNSQTDLTEKYAMKRNCFYWISITSVAGAGANSEPGVDPKPENPIETETWMKGEIQILDWTVIDQNGGI